MTTAADLLVAGDTDAGITFCGAATSGVVGTLTVLSTTFQPL